LLRRTRVWNNVHSRAGNGGFDPSFDFFECLHRAVFFLTAICPSFPDPPTLLPDPANPVNPV
jgi:hypothetical protein